MQGAHGCALKLLLPAFLLSLVPYFSKGQEKELENLEHQLAQSKDSLQSMRLMNKIGFFIHMKSADSSFYYGERANRIAEQLNDNRGRADALANIGIGLALKGLYSQSLQYYSQAYKAYAKLPDTQEMAQMLMNSAITYSFTTDSVFTSSFAQRAVAMAQNFKTDSMTAMLYANYADLGGLKADSVNFYLNAAEKIAVNYKDDRSLLFIDQQRAGILLDKKDYKGALALIKKSLQVARQHQWEYHELEGLDEYGKYFLKINQPDSALKCYRRIEQVAAANGYIFWKIDVLKYILNIYRIKNDLPAQLKTSEALTAALEQMRESSNSFLGDYIKSDENQAKLEKLNRLNIRDHYKQLWFVAISIAGSVLTLAILFAYQNSRRQKRELQVLNDKITAQNTELQNNEEFNSLLLSMLAHDFRAPLGQTMAMISLLKDNEEPDLRTRLRFYDEVEDSIKNVLNTFDNILQWLKKQLSGYKPVIDPVNLHELIEESRAFFKQPIEKKSLIFNNLIDPEMVAGGDVELMRFINRNLVHNAVKHAPADSVVTASVKYKQNEVIVAIRNEGKGMTQQQVDDLFKFKEQHSGEKGAGMAMALSREFIALMNGKIWAESIPGVTTTFFYALPV